MSGVARGQRGMVGEHDSGDHRVPQITTSASFLPSRHQICRLVCCGSVKWGDAAPHGVERRLECLHEKRSPFAACHDLQPEANLKDSHRVHPYGTARLPIEPREHVGVRARPHQFGYDVAIEDNQGSNDAGLMRWPRNSGTSASQPRLRNKPAISLPRLPAGVASSWAAFRRMSRTSSSILRP